MGPCPGCPGAMGPGGLHLERPFPNATAATKALVSPGLNDGLFSRDTDGETCWGFDFNQDEERNKRTERCDLPALSASLSSRGLFSFSSRLEHILFSAWICFCSMIQRWVNVKHTNCLIWNMKNKGVETTCNWPALHPDRCAPHPCSAASPAPPLPGRVWSAGSLGRFHGWTPGHAALWGPEGGITREMRGRNPKTQEDNSENTLTVRSSSGFWDSTRGMMTWLRNDGVLSFFSILLMVFSWPDRRPKLSRTLGLRERATHTAAVVKCCTIKLEKDKVVLHPMKRK